VSRVTERFAPTKTGIATADVLTGLHAALGILAALHHRQETGEGQLVEVNLMSSMLSGLVNFGGAYALTGNVARGMGIRHEGICPYEPFATKDRRLVVAAANDGLFRTLCDCLDLPAVKTDRRFATNRDRVAHRDALGELLAAVLVTRTADEWFDVLTDAGVPCGPINDVAQGMDLATSLGLEPIVDVDGSAQVAHPVRLSRTPASYRHAPPGLGADQKAIRDWIDAEIGDEEGLP